MTKKLTLILITIVVSIIVLVIFQTDPGINVEMVTAEDGFLDLGDWAIDEAPSLNVSGNWEVYSDVLLDPNQFTDRSFLLIPDAYLPLTEGDNARPGLTNTTGLWTYRLRVIMPEDQRLLGLAFKDVMMASKVFVNGIEVGGSGEVGLEVEGYVQKPIPFDAYFTNTHTITNIVVQVANHDYYKPGNPVKMNIGRADVIRDQTLILSSITAAGVLVAFVLAIYCMILYSAKIQEEPMIYMSVQFLAFSVLLLTIGVTFIYKIFPSISYSTVTKIQGISNIVLSASTFFYISAIEPEILGRRWLVPLTASYIALVIFELITPLSMQPNGFLMISGLGIIISLVLATRAVIFIYRKRDLMRDRRLSRWHVVMLVSLCVANLNQLLLDYELLLLKSFGEIALLMFLLSGYVIVGRRFIHSYRRSHAVEKLRDEFITRVSYELRTPLETIVNLAEDYLEPQEEATDIDPAAGGAASAVMIQSTTAQQIQFIAEHMISSIESTWDLSLLSQGQVNIDKKAVPISTIIDVVDAAVSFYYPKKQIETINDVEKLIYVWADPDRLRQVLFNLAQNAAESMDEGWIRFSAEVKDRMVEIFIEDNGCGIDENEQSRIFNSYVSLRGNGVGLGLPISKRVAKKMGGQLKLERSTLGQGSTFKLVLPDASSEASYLGGLSVDIQRGRERLTQSVSKLVNIAENSSLSNFRKNNDARKASTKRVDDEGFVIILDRDVYYLNNTAVSLAEAGYRSLKLQSALGLTELVQKTSPDLIIMDIALAEFSGLDLTRKLREQWSLLELPILMTSLSSDNADLRLALEAGANDYIAKPFDSWSLNNRVGSLIQLKDAMQQAISSELAFLQAQIKPHFIYNALSTITYFCYTDSQRAAELLNQFSRYLRLTFDIDPKRDTVPLSRELALVDAYFEIEKARFGDKIEFIKDIEPGSERVDVPILCLQPLVENSIKHGLLNKDEGGHVKLSAKTIDNKTLEIRVIDNGEGMSEARLAELRQGYDHSDKNASTEKPKFAGLDPDRLENPESMVNNVECQSVGFQNIKRRLERWPNASIEVLSAESLGTEVILNFDLARTARH